MTRLTLAQITCQLHDKEENLRRMREVVTGSEGDIVVFPELSLTGYMPRDDMFALAERTDGPTVSSVVRLAKETEKDIVFGMPMLRDDLAGPICNSCLLASGEGRVYRYDKMYLPTFGPFEERVFFALGSSPVVAKGMHAKIGLTVCYDIFFPELAKLEALLGADMLINVSASPTTSRASFEKVMPARALENGVFLAHVNLIGVHGSLVFNGGSMLIDPKGEVVAEAKELKEDIVETEFDIGEVATARRFRPLTRDVRADVLDDLCELLKLKNESEVDG